MGFEDRWSLMVVVSQDRFHCTCPCMLPEGTDSHHLTERERQVELTRLHHERQKVHAEEEALGAAVVLGLTERQDKNNTYRLVSN